MTYNKEFYDDITKFLKEQDKEFRIKTGLIYANDKFWQEVNKEILKDVRKV